MIHRNNAGEWISYHYAAGSSAGFPLKISSEGINEKLILPYAAAFLLSINDTERRKIFTINQLDNREGRGRFKEVYIRRGAVGEVYGIEVSLAQYLTYTTEKPEKSAVEIYTEHYGTYPTGLDAFLADLQLSQKSLPDFITAVNLAGAPL